VVKIPSPLAPPMKIRTTEIGKKAAHRIALKTGTVRPETGRENYAHRDIRMVTA